ncbi:MAG: hypothetical protein WD046_04380 [Paracoccaceae bacterium]
MLRLATALSALFLTVPVFLWADEAPGTVTGTIGDRSVTVEIWAAQSDFYGDGNAGGVSIMTMPVARDEGLGAISIGFEGSDFLEGDIFSFEIDIRDSAAENMSGYYAFSDSGLQFTVTRAEKSDGVLFIAGTVQGTLIWRQLMPISERRDDPSRQLSVDLEFNAILENEY